MLPRGQRGDVRQRRGDLLPCSFDLPCFLLALSAFPLHYLPELLGANLYYYAAGVSPAMLGLAPRLQALGAHGAFLEAHSPSEVSASMEALAIDVANWMLAGEGGEHGGAAMRARRLRGRLRNRALAR